MDGRALATGGAKSSLSDGKARNIFVHPASNGQSTATLPLGMTRR